jgi:hypothetical protein
MPRSLAVLLFLCSCARAEPIQKLRPPALQRLDTGATKPQGWLKDELLLQAKGLSGQLPYFWGYFNSSAWMKDPVPKSSGGKPHQFIPYFINGLFPLSYQVEDENIAAWRKRYVDFIISHQNTTNECGWLGPPIARTENPNQHDPPAHNYWSKYLAVQAFESYAEAEPWDSERVIKALLAHHRQWYHQAKAHDPPISMSRWGFARYEDSLVGIQWLIDRTTPSADTAFLWDLLMLLRNETTQVMTSVSAKDGGGFTWEQWFKKGDPFAPHNDSEATGTSHLLRHGVDIGEAMKVGALWWRVDGTEEERSSPWNAIEWAEKYLHMSDGMYFADEEVQGLHSPSRGTETCSVVETMFSMRTAYEITGKTLNSISSPTPAASY